jgi:hypothetical protein
MATLEEILQSGIRDGVVEGIKSKLTSSYGPLSKIVEDAITGQLGPVKDLINQSIATCVNDADFRNQIITGTRSMLAKKLVERFGGEIEKQINALKSDPTTRARIVIAIEEIVASTKQ